MNDTRRYVEPVVSEARVERVWSNVSQRLVERSSRSWRWALLGGALAVAAAGALWVGRTSDEASQQTPLGARRLEARSEPLALALKDGSALELAPRSALVLRGEESAQVSLALARGRVRCDVAHRPGRQFSVHAGDVEVRVVGTRFSVTSTEGTAPRVEVSVLRGAVEVRSARRPGVVARVAAGESWVQEAGTAPSKSPDDGTQIEVAPSAAPPNPSPAPGKSANLAAAAASNTVSAAASARELFEQAGERRRSGDAAGAARAYEELLRLHPSDGRAGLSAFELGRLRMDRLGDPAGAVAALERALASSLGPSFREDALARLVGVYAAQGNFAACGRARDRYLASYPAGVHAAAVASRCGAR